MYNKTPKCDRCMPDVMDENQVTLDVYFRVHNQHIMSFSGPIDLNFQSVKFVMDLLGISNQKEIFERVYNLYKWMLNKHYEEMKHQKGEET